jgi:hypothetical protein
MTNADRKADRSFLRGCLTGLVIFLLALGLTFSTLTHLQHNDAFACFGGLGAGFPVSFLCDYSGGGSPLSSAGKIDLADFPYFSPQGTLVDLLFYAMQVGAVWSLVNSILRKRYGMAVLVLLVYLAGFLSALILFQPFPLRIERYYPRTPTPTFYTPTPFGTPPPPAQSPVPTSRP